MLHGKFALKNEISAITNIKENFISQSRMFFTLYIVHHAQIQLKIQVHEGLLEVTSPGYRLACSAYAVM